MPASQAKKESSFASFDVIRCVQINGLPKYMKHCKFQNIVYLFGDINQYSYVEGGSTVHYDYDDSDNI